MATKRKIRKTITLAWLKKMDACANSRELFKRIFGSECPTTRSSLRAFALLCSYQNGGEAGYHSMMNCLAPKLLGHKYSWHLHPSTARALRRAFEIRRDPATHGWQGPANAMAAADTVAFVLQLPD